jgi:acyl-CoA synthetase (AMP-forming)/AMP-acid ligase II
VNIAPAEIECELVSHEAVIDAAVVGIPDPRSGEAVLAYVVCANGARLDEEELRDYLSNRLATYKIPQHFVCLDELPRTGRGKLDRKALQDKGALDE